MFILSILGFSAIMLIIFILISKIAFNMNKKLTGEVISLARKCTDSEFEFFRTHYVLTGGRAGSKANTEQVDKWCETLTCVDGDIENVRKEADAIYGGYNYVFIARFLDGIISEQRSILGVPYNEYEKIASSQHCHIIGYCAKDDKGQNRLICIALRPNNIILFND